MKSTVAKIIDRNTRHALTDDDKRQFKRDLLDLFRKYGYLSEDKDHEVTFRTTSGNIAWININSIEVIK